MEEYLQGDEWNMQGEEEQVVLIHFNNVTVLNLLVVFLFLFFFFPRLEHKSSGLHREKCH